MCSLLRRCQPAPSRDLSGHFVDPLGPSKTHISFSSYLCILSPTSHSPSFVILSSNQIDRCSGSESPYSRSYSFWNAPAKLHNGSCPKCLRALVQVSPLLSPPPSPPSSLPLPTFSRNQNEGFQLKGICKWHPLHASAPRPYSLTRTSPEPLSDIFRPSSGQRP